MTATLDTFIAGKGWQVPALSVMEFTPARNPYALVIPVINEGERIRKQLTEIHAAGFADSLDVIVADGGSTDNSLEEGFLRSVGVRALLVKTGPGKLSAQLRCAYAFVLQQGYRGVITIDGNGKDSIDSLPRFIAALDSGIDYAQASRFVAGGQGINTPLSRLLAIRLLHAPVLSIAGRRWFTDTTQGYRAYSARYLSDARVQPFRDVFVKYELLAYLTVRAGQLGYKTVEIPTRRTYPANEPVPTKIGGMSAYADLMRTLWNTLTGRYLPPSAGSSKASG